MKTIPELLSSQFDEELRVLVAEAYGWRPVEGLRMFPPIKWVKARVTPEVFDQIACVDHMVIPEYSTSLDACRELLEDLTEEEKHSFSIILSGMLWLPENSRGWEDWRDTWTLLRATARQICVASLIVKNVLK